ncbi:MAG: hypothetical protein B6I22_06665 [Desulfobacteraceae bacterium 4572_123]|nr:MAG: hypothetical protein B6I22_06665 [Desulfobacteraceae bacterium 4572_123]
MKAKTILLALLCSIFFTTAFCQAAEQQAVPGPKAVFPEKHFEFPSVLEGTEVRHDFIIQNSGPGILKILKVLTG